jgi:hypothetical protein
MREEPGVQLFVQCCSTLLIIALWIWNIVGGGSLVAAILLTGVWLCSFVPWWIRVRRGRR